MSEFFTSSNVDVGHERIFNGNSLLSRKSGAEFMHMELAQKCQGESSWMVVPFINYFSSTTKIIYMLRDPVKVIKSFYEFGAMKYPSYSPSIRFAQSLLPEMRTDDELYNAAAYCMVWNDMAFEKISEVKNEVVFFDIENSDVGKIEKFLDIPIKGKIAVSNARVSEKNKVVSLEAVCEKIYSDPRLRNSYHRIESIRSASC